MFSKQSARDLHIKIKHDGFGIPATSKQDRTEFNKKCPKCERHFKYDFSVKYHIERFHSQESNVGDTETTELRCNLCDKSFKHKVSLDRHKNSHDDEKESFDCDRCASKFTRKDNLTKHRQRMHKLVNLNVDMIRKTSKGDFICKMCGSNFGNDHRKYETHLMVKACQQSNEEDNFEVDEKGKFPCLQCDKKYADKDSLMRHVRWKHRGIVKDFKCAECEASFKLKSSLVRHLKQSH